MRRSFRYAALALAALVLIALLFHTAILTGLAAYLDQSGPPAQADAVFVLAGDSTGSRILKAAQLVREGYAPRVVVSGPSGYYGSYECDVAIPFAVKAGYPQSYFVRFPNEARSTREEAAVGAVELHSLGVHRVLLVTSLYHTRRAGDLFRAAAPDLTFLVVSAPYEPYTTNGWWHDREGRKVFLNEWTKTVAGWFHI